MALTPITPVEAAPGIPDPENRITFSSLMYGLLRWIVDKMAPGVNDLAQATYDNASETLTAASTAAGAAVAASNLADAAAASATAAGSSASSAYGYANQALDSKSDAEAAAAAAAASASSVNSAYLLNRGNHTGAQAIGTVTGLQTALDAKAADNAVVKLTGAQDVYGLKEFKDGVSVVGNINNSPAHRQPAINLTGTTLDFAAGTDFYKTISSNTTIALTNVSAAAGLAQAASLIVNHTGGTITFSGATIKWNGGSAPTLTTGRVHQFFLWPDPITNQVLVSLAPFY